MDDDKSKLKDIFKPRIFNRSNRSLGESAIGESPSRALSPLEKSEIMY